MNDLEKLYIQRLQEKDAAKQEVIKKHIAIRDKKIELCHLFLKKIEFLNKYGFRWELRAHCNNGNDCCMGYYEWNVYLFNPTMATTPFENTLIVKEIEGEIKAKFRPTILGHGRHVKGQDKDGYFTAEQFVMAFS